MKLFVMALGVMAFLLVAPSAEATCREACSLQVVSRDCRHLVEPTSGSYRTGVFRAGRWERFVVTCGGVCSHGGESSVVAGSDAFPSDLRIERADGSAVRAPLERAGQCGGAPVYRTRLPAGSYFLQGGPVGLGMSVRETRLSARDLELSFATPQSETATTFDARWRGRRLWLSGRFREVEIAGRRTARRVQRGDDGFETSVRWPRNVACATVTATSQQGSAAVTEVLCLPGAERPAFRLVTSPQVIAGEGRVQVLVEATSFEGDGLTLFVDGQELVYNTWSEPNEGSRMMWVGLIRSGPWELTARRTIGGEVQEARQTIRRGASSEPPRANELRIDAVTWLSPFRLRLDGNIPSQPILLDGREAPVVSRDAEGVTVQHTRSRGGRAIRVQVGADSERVRPGRRG